MKIKDTINFKTLREKGPSAIDLEGEDVVQLVSSKKEIMCIVRQEYLLHLESAYHRLLVHQGLRLKEEKTVNLDFELKRNFNPELNKIMSLASADEKEFKSNNILGAAASHSSDSLLEEVTELKKKLARLEENHPDFFKEKKK